MPQTVLIAGGSGLIGRALTQELIQQGYVVKLLGRKANKIANVETFVWDPNNNKIDEQALKNTDYIINLAGANVGEGRWTERRKKELLDSRTLSTSLLVNSIIKNKYPIRKFIQANAIGFYGLSHENITFTEKDLVGNDFLATLCDEWEKAAEPLQQTTIPLLILRIGVVLSNKGGALMAMTKPVQLFVGSALGNGKQIVPWIHIDDIVSIVMKGIREPEMKGVYNATAPTAVSNKQLTKLIGKAIKRPVWPFGVPSFVLKMLLGEQAQIVLKGNRVSSQKLIEYGFQFKYSQPEEAIKNLFAGD